MKKKHIIIIVVVIAVIILAILAVVLFRKNSRSKTKGKMYKETDHPISYVTKGDNLIVTLKDKKDPKQSWQVRIEDDTRVQVKAKGKETGSTVKYEIIPTDAGSVTVDFVKATEVAGMTIDTVTASFPLYITSTNDGLKLSVNGIASLTEMPYVVAADSDNPVIVFDTDTMNDYQEDEESPLDVRGHFYFVNGRNDWTIESTDGQLGVRYTEYNGKYVAGIVLPADAYDPEASAEEGAISDTEEEDIEKASGNGATPTSATDEMGTGYIPPEETPTDATATDAVADVKSEITLSSASLGITEKYNVTMAADGTVSIEKVQEK